jgi:hypothetical protein
MFGNNTREARSPHSKPAMLRRPPLSLPAWTPTRDAHQWLTLLYPDCLALAARHGLIIVQANVKKAYFHKDLAEDLYTKVPKGVLDPHLTLIDNYSGYLDSN